ncbi:MAG TPA: hypothetical protein VN598_06540, partial [Usitatibacter sp.]|nr:hypothetical protein [Usitatibacter sp.]
RMVLLSSMTITRTPVRFLESATLPSMSMPLAREGWPRRPLRPVSFFPLPKPPRLALLRIYSIRAGKTTFVLPKQTLTTKF